MNTYNIYQYAAIKNEWEKIFSIFEKISVKELEFVTLITQQIP